MNKKALIGLGLTAALAGAVATPAIVTAPTFAYADEAFTEVDTLTKLQTALDAGKSVKLTQNITGSVTVPAGKTLTIDLNGKSITATTKWAAITNNGNLTVIGSGTVDGSSLGGTAALYNAPGADATLKGGMFTGSKWYVMKNLGKLTIDGASVDQKDAGSSAIDNGYYGNTGNDCGLASPNSGTVESNGVSLTIKSGTFTGGMNVVKNDDYARLTIDGGTYTNTTGPAVLNWSETTINGGSFSVTDSASAVVANGSYDNPADKGELKITGGTFTAPNDGSGSVFTTGVGGKSGGNVALSGGEYKGSFSNVSDLNITASIDKGVTFSDLSTLASAAKYLDKGLAVETSDGTTFTVATVADAKDGAGCVVSPNLTTDKEIKVYFKGDKETAEALADSTFAMGDDSTGTKPAAEKLPLAAVLVQNSYFDVDGTTSAAGSTTRGITEDEYSNNKLTVDLTNLPKAEKDGYVFAGWQAYTDSDGADKLEPVSGKTLTTSFDENDIKKADPQTDKATLYVNFFASWYNDHVTVKFDTDGGSKVSDLSLEVNSDGEATLKASDLKTPTKAGYTFDGWAMEVMGEDGNVTLEKVTFPKTLGATLITKDNPTATDVFTLKATWKKNATTPSEDKGETNNNGENANKGNNGETTNNGETANKNAGTTTTTTVKKAVQTSVLPATGDNAIAAAAGIAAAGAATVAAAAATKRRKNNA